MPGPTPPAWSSGLEPLHHAARDAARTLAHRAGSVLADSRPGGAIEIVPLDRAAGRLDRRLHDPARQIGRPHQGGARGHARDLLGGAAEV